MSPLKLPILCLSLSEFLTPLHRLVPSSLYKVMASSCLSSYLLGPTFIRIHSMYGPSSAYYQRAYTVQSNGTGQYSAYQGRSYSYHPAVQRPVSAYQREALRPRFSRALYITYTFLQAQTTDLERTRRNTIKLPLAPTGVSLRPSGSRCKNSIVTSGLTTVAVVNTRLFIFRFFLALGPDRTGSFVSLCGDPRDCNCPSPSHDCNNPPNRVESRHCNFSGPQGSPFASHCQ